MTDTEVNDEYDARSGLLWKRRGVEKFDGIIYTEDDIPVRTIFVSNINNSTANEDDLRQAFSDYGQLESIKVFSRPNCSRSSAFVTFVNAVDAASVLNKVRDFYDLRISTAYSWHQPQPANPPDEAENTSDSILLLNDDCLIETFSYLDLVDLAKISKVCVRFANLAQIVFKTHEHVDSTLKRSDRLITLMEWKDVLEAMGRHIKSLYIKPRTFLNPPGIKIFEMVSKYCPNLETLSLEEFSLTRTVYKLKPLLRRIKTLILDNCAVRQNFIEMFNARWQLETLHFKNSYEITGARLDLLIHLKSLAFTSCGNIQPKYLSQLIEHQQNLESLSLVRCDRLTSSTFRGIALNSTRLNKLEIEFSPGCRSNCREEDLFPLGNLPNLTKFHFECDTSINISPLLAILAEKNLLEELDISCRTIDDRSFEEILKLTNLKVLHMNRTNVNEKWLVKIGKQLKHLTELHLIDSVQVNDEGLMRLLKQALNLKLIDISKTSVTLDGLLSCIKFLYTQIGHPLLEVWFSDIDYSEAHEQRNKLKPYRRVAKVDFGVVRPLDIYHKYFCKAPDSDTMSGQSLSDVYYNSDDDLNIF